MPALRWHAQAIPRYDKLLQEPQQAAVLAGGHCIPVSLPQPERFAWHKLFSSAMRVNEPEKAKQDLAQAATLLALLAEQDDVVLAESFQAAPAEVRAAAKTRLPGLRGLLQAHPQTLEQVEREMAWGAANEHVTSLPGVRSSDLPQGYCSRREDVDSPLCSIFPDPEAQHKH